MKDQNSTESKNTNYIDSKVKVNSNEGNIIGTKIEIHNSGELSIKPSYRPKKYLSDASVLNYLKNLEAHLEEQLEFKPKYQKKRTHYSGATDSSEVSDIKNYYVDLYEQEFFLSRKNKTNESFKLIDAIIDLAEANRKLVAIVGEPGVGKTPAVLKLQQEIASNSKSKLSALISKKPKTSSPTDHNKESNAPEKAKVKTLKKQIIIPFLLPVDQMTPHQQIRSLVRKTFNTHAKCDSNNDQLFKLLESYRCLFIIPDIDKPFSGNEETTLLNILSFIRSQEDNLFLITGRTEDTRIQRFRPWKTYRLNELTDAQLVNIFGKKASSFSVTFPRNRNLLEMIIDNSDSSDSIDKVAYWSRGRIIKSVIENWEHTVKKNKNRYEILTEVLEDLAYSMHLDRTYRYSEIDVMKSITNTLIKWNESPHNWRKLFRVLTLSNKSVVHESENQHSKKSDKNQSTPGKSSGSEPDENISILSENEPLLVQDNQKRWRFCKRTFHAYFVASALRNDKERIKDLPGNITDYWWKEPVEILVGLVEEPSELIFDILEKDVLLAARCTKLAGEHIEENVIDAIIDSLYQQTRSERSKGRIEIIQALGEAANYQSTTAFLWNILLEERKSEVLFIAARVLSDMDDASQEVVTNKYNEEKLRIVKELLYDWQHPKRLPAGAASLIASCRKYRKRNRPTPIDKLISGLLTLTIGVIGAEPKGNKGYVKTEEEEYLRNILKQPPKSDFQNFLAWCATEALCQFDMKEMAIFARKNLVRLEKKRSERPHLSELPDQYEFDLRTHFLYLLGKVGHWTEDYESIFNTSLSDENGYVKGIFGKSHLPATGK